MQNPKVETWEARLNALLRKVDASLEARYGNGLSLHPARPAAGETANPQQDGLFTVNATFTPGFGSQYGRGYAIAIEIVSLEEPTPEFRAQIEETAVREISTGLSTAFPGKSFRIVRDGPIWKLIGDLSLGEAHS